MNEYERQILLRLTQSIIEQQKFEQLSPQTMNGLEAIKELLEEAETKCTQNIISREKEFKEETN